MIVSWRKKKQAIRNPDQLVDIIFSWSIDDIMNTNLYKYNVNDIDDTFPSLKHYLNSFINPLIEETHADLRSNMTTLQSAPVIQVLEVAEDDHFDPRENLLYELKLEEYDKNAEYEPQIGDLIVLSQVRPKCIDDLHGTHLSYHFALVQDMRDESDFLPILSSKPINLGNADGEYNFLPILCSKPINLGNADGEFRHTLFAVYLTNLTTNLRIWNALHQGEEPTTGILNSVLRIDPSMQMQMEECGHCSDQIESGDVSKSRELIMSLGLDESQRDAVLQCIALRGCSHRNSVKLIWGPPGTGKTKTVASLLFSLLKIKCRTLTCAPTNVAILGVAKRLMSCLNGSYGLGDVVLFGNGERMNIADHQDVHDVFLDFRVSALMHCFAPQSGWRGRVDDMILLLRDPQTQYQRYLEKLMEDGCNNTGELVEDGTHKAKSKNEFLRKLVVENEKRNRVTSKRSKKKNKKASCQERRKPKRGDEGARRKQKVEEMVPWTFEEYFANDVVTITEQIALCTELLCSNMPTSCLPLDELSAMTKAIAMLEILGKFLSDNEWSKGDLMGSDDKLCSMRLLCLEMMNTISSTQLPKLYDRYEVRCFCLQNSCLVFCTVSSSAKLYTQGTAPFELAIIDEAAQVKECESTIPLQLPGLRHAVLVGDEKQLPAMVISEICERAGFGRSLFERLVILGHSKHLLNIQYRMHPSISLFPNKEFYGNQIMNGRNVTERGHERRFLKEKLFGTYSFINVTNGKEEFDARYSRKNIVEVSVVAHILSKLYKESMKSKEKVRVGCISPYKAQVFAIQDLLGKTYSSDAKDKFSVNVRSVDGFQGGEEDIIIISTVRCNGNGSIGFLDNLQRTNVALTRARYCLWILGNAATLQNSGSVWGRLVADAKTRGCFHNASEDKNLCRGICNALIELGQQRCLFTADSLLFKAAKWKVCFSDEFHKSITRYHDSEIFMEAASLLEKLSNGWRQQREDEAGIRDEGPSSRLLERDVVKGLLRLFWTIDILRENSTDTQVIKVLDLLPLSQAVQVVKKFDLLVGDYTINHMNRCLCKKSEGGLVLPMTWPVDRANSTSNYSSNDLATQLSTISLRNDPRRRKHMKRRENHRGRTRV